MSSLLHVLPSCTTRLINKSHLLPGKLCCAELERSMLSHIPGSLRELRCTGEQDKPPFQLAGEGLATSTKVGVKVIQLTPSLLKQITMATTLCSVTPVARLGKGRLGYKAPSKVGAKIVRPTRAASKFRVNAYTITLKTPSGDETVECGGAAFFSCWKC